MIRLARLQGRVDVRCLLAGQFVLDNPARRPHEAPFHLLLEGRCVVAFAGGRIQLQPGDLVMFPRGTAHRVLSDRDGRQTATVKEPGSAFPTLRTSGAETDIDLFCGQYTLAPGAGTLLFQTLPDPLHVSLGTDPHEPARVLSALMRQEAQANGPGTAAIVSSLCDALLAMVLRGAPARRLSQGTLWTSTDDQAVTRAVEAVLREPEREWTMAGLAALAAMSRATFIRHFTSATGMAVGEFLTQIRMMIAADLLIDTERPVSAIATAVGYRSDSAFGRAFRMATDTTPTQFRRDARTATRGTTQHDTVDPPARPVLWPDPRAAADHCAGRP
jgi:AraC family transcriptional activator of mtrCDE